LRKLCKEELHYLRFSPNILPLYLLLIGFLAHSSSKLASEVTNGTYLVGLLDRGMGRT
jgi:hypothetical protein